MVIVLNLFVLRLFPLSIYQHILPNDNMIIGVIDMIVIITIEAVISRHIVDIDKQDINRLLFECSFDILRKFGNILEILFSFYKINLSLCFQTQLLHQKQ